MCTDLNAAKRNRHMVKYELNTSGYLFVESLVKGWPRKKPLPEWLWGYIPSVGKHEVRELFGFHEIKE